LSNSQRSFFSGHPEC